jgi:hypothetical protein
LQNLYEAYRNLLGPLLLLPPTPDLLEIFDKERLIWQGGPAKIPEQETKPTELGTEIMSVCVSSQLYCTMIANCRSQLRSSDPNYTQTLQLYRLTEKCFSLLLAKAAISEGRDKETM